jgi:LysR family hydrogen peroxide-inducible transcriptional activator
MAVETGAMNTPGVALTPFSDAGVSRQIGLMWRRKTPRRAEFRLLGDCIIAAHEAQEKGAVPVAQQAGEGAAGGGAGVARSSQG